MRDKLRIFLLALGGFVFSAFLFSNISWAQQVWSSGAIKAGEPIRAAHINEIKMKIQDRLNKCGITFSWDSALASEVGVGDPIRAAHINELQRAIEAIYNGPWGPPAGMTRVNAGDPISLQNFRDLRSRVEDAKCCGDGYCLAPEDNSACPSDCPSCDYDGIREGPEECDNGPDNGSPDGCTACKWDCGNTTIEVSAGETCDDGNRDDNDGCSSACQREPRCGDSFLDFPEFCDDGNNRDNDGCSSNCQLEVICGDNRTEGSEECDDGNRDNSDICTNLCRRATCSDGERNQGEDGPDCGGPCSNVCECPGGVAEIGIWGVSRHGGQISCNAALPFPEVPFGSTQTVACGGECTGYVTVYCSADGQGAIGAPRTCCRDLPDNAHACANNLIWNGEVVAGIYLDYGLVNSCATPGYCQAECNNGYVLQGGVCVDGCANGVQDGVEAGVDCGGSCPRSCAPITCGDSIFQSGQEFCDSQRGGCTTVGGVWTCFGGCQLLNGYPNAAHPGIRCNADCSGFERVNAAQQGCCWEMDIRPSSPTPNNTCQDTPVGYSQCSGQVCSPSISNQWCYTLGSACGGGKKMVTWQHCLCI